MAYRTLIEVALVYMITVVTNRIRNIKRKIIAPFFGCNTKQLPVLLFA